MTAPTIRILSATLLFGLVAGAAHAADAPKAAASAAKPKAAVSAPAPKAKMPAAKDAAAGGDASLSKDQGANTSTVKAPPKPKVPEGTTTVPEVQKK